MSELGMRLGGVIRSKRRELGLSLEGAASLAGINRSYLGEIERGEVEASAAKLDAVAHALGMRLSELIRACEEQETSRTRA